MVIIVDVQNDFIEGGKLAVNGGLQVSKNIQEWLTSNMTYEEKIVLTQDFHPVGHCSFKDNGGEWPEHCVAFTAGAAIEESLIQYLGKLNIDYVVQRKGTEINKDMYSFLDDLEQMAMYSVDFNNADRIVVTGIVGTVCVKNTIQDLINMGYAEKVIVPINCVAHFDDNAKQELIDWLKENNIKIKE